MASIKNRGTASETFTSTEASERRCECRVIRSGSAGRSRARPKISNKQNRNRCDLKSSTTNASRSDPFFVIGATVEGSSAETIDGTDELRIEPLSGTEQRTLVIQDLNRTVGKVVRLTPELVAELDGTIQLLPLATVRAQLYDITGFALNKASIHASVLPNQKHLRRLKSVATDTKGNVELKVPCWSKYPLWYDGNSTAFESTVSVFPGKTYDLGKVIVNTDEMVPPEEAKRQQLRQN